MKTYPPAVTKRAQFDQYFGFDDDACCTGQRQSMMFGTRPEFDDMWYGFCLDAPMWICAGATQAHYVKPISILRG